jgi:HAD superfamily hydrolase (TIGR01549 family)
VRNVNIIVFDLDGTLVDAREDIVAAVKHTLEKTGKEEKSFEQIVSYIGTGAKDLIRQSLSEEDDEELVREALGYYLGYFSEHYADKSTLYPHVKETLGYFREKKLAVLTNRKGELAQKTLKKFSIDKYFEKIKGADDDICLKPATCAINDILSQTSVKKDKAIIVGDMDIDIKAGKEAGILTCGVTYGIGSQKDLKKADPEYLIDDLFQLSSLIK